MLYSFFSSTQTCGRRGLLAGLVLTLGLAASAWGAPPAPQLAPQEFEAIKNISAIRQAQTDYSQIQYEYAATFADLASSTPVYLACDFSAAVGGYTFTLALSGAGYSVTAEPSDVAWVHLYANENAIYSAYGATATAASSVMAINLGLGSCYQTDGATIAANQAAATTDLCAIASAQAAYWRANLSTYTLTLADLGIGDFSAPRNGYNFLMVSDGSAYMVTADPVNAASGLYGFYFDSITGIVHAEAGASAGGASPVFAAQCDSDHDGLNNEEEAAMFTSFQLADTDLDGMSDGDEVTFGYDPTNPTDSAALPAASWYALVAVMASLAAGGFVLRRKHGAANS